VDGPTLAEDLRAEAPLAPERAARVGADIAAALAYAHAKGVIHRDVKPSNVLLAPTGNAKVADFGIAKVPERSTVETNPGVVLGTPAYLSPEQLRGERADPRSDVYSLGAVLYEMVTGRKPFVGDTPAEVAGNVLHHRPPRPSGVNPEVPAAFEGILSKALSREPHERYRDANELRVDLLEFADGRAPAAEDATTAIAAAPLADATRAMTVAAPVETAAAPPPPAAANGGGVAHRRDPGPRRDRRHHRPPRQQRRRRQHGGHTERRQPPRERGHVAAAEGGPEAGVDPAERPGCEEGRRHRHRPAGGHQGEEEFGAEAVREHGPDDVDDPAGDDDPPDGDGAGHDEPIDHRVHDAVHVDTGHDHVAVDLGALMLTSMAHTAVCVPDVEEAVRWYESVLGLTVIWSPVLMENDDIQKDMGELIPAPAAVKGAIIGVGDASASGDRVLEVIQYPHAPGRAKAADATLTDHGYSHVGLVCDDLAATRAELEAKGVQFLTEGIADIVGLRTTWFEDPWRNVFILMEKRHPEKAYYSQY